MRSTTTTYTSTGVTSFFPHRAPARAAGRADEGRRCGYVVCVSGVSFARRGPPTPIPCLFPTRHVVLPPDIAKLLPKNRLLSEVRMRALQPLCTAATRVLRRADELTLLTCAARSADGVAGAWRAAVARMGALCHPPTRAAHYALQARCYGPLAHCAWLGSSVELLSLFADRWRCVSALSLPSPPQEAEGLRCAGAAWGERCVRWYACMWSSDWLKSTPLFTLPSLTWWMWSVRGRRRYSMQIDVTPCRGGCQPGSEGCARAPRLTQFALGSMVAPSAGICARPVYSLCRFPHF